MPTWLVGKGGVVRLEKLPAQNDRKDEHENEKNRAQKKSEEQFALVVPMEHGFPPQFTDLLLMCVSAKRAPSMQKNTRRRNAPNIKLYQKTQSISNTTGYYLGPIYALVTWIKILNTKGTTVSNGFILCGKKSTLKEYR